MLNFAAFLTLTAITVATIGEGLTSSEPGSKITAGHRWFTIYTLQQACESTPVPAYLTAEPITLFVGDRFALEDAVVSAYDAAGAFIPEVPIEILDPDTTNARLSKQAHTATQHYLALEPGEKTIEIRAQCVGPPWVSVEVLITILEAEA